MAEIKLHRRVKYAGDVHTELLKAGWDCETAAMFCDNIPDADVATVVHGEWIEEERRPKGMRFICSECAKIAYFPPNRQGTKNGRSIAGIISVPTAGRGWMEGNDQINRNETEASAAMGGGGMGLPTFGFVRCAVPDGAPQRTRNTIYINEPETPARVSGGVLKTLSLRPYS